MNRLTRRWTPTPAGRSRVPLDAGHRQRWANDRETTDHEDIMKDKPFNTGFLAGVLVMIGAQAVGWFIQSPGVADASALRMAAVITQAVIGFGGATWLYARERGRTTRAS
jgi:hypothetical protein